MAWTTPRTWVPLEVVSAALLNTHIRDNENVLKTAMDDNGLLKTQHFGVGFSVGAGNVSTGETDLAGYSFTIAANLLADGDALRLRGLCTLANNTNAKTLRFYIGTQFNTILASAAAVASNIGQFDLILTRRSSTVCAVQGFYLKDAAPAAAPTIIAVNFGLSSLNFGSSQTSKLTGQGGATDDLKMAEYSVEAIRGNGTIK